MTKLTTLLTILLTLHLQATTLRISLVVEKDAPNSTKFTQKHGDSTSEIHILNTPIVTGKDIENASPNYPTNTVINITLNDVGAKRLETATRNLEPGKHQLATIIDGKLHNVATLQAEVLSKRFIISGLDPETREAPKLAAGLMGKKYTPPTPEEIAERKADMQKAEEMQAATKGIKPRLTYEFPGLRKDRFTNNELIEHLKIDDITQPINQIDLTMIAYPYLIIAQNLENDAKTSQEITTNCDSIKILAHHFPKIKTLIANKKNIKATTIADIVQPAYQDLQKIPKTIQIDLNPGHEHLLPKYRKLSQP